jgi:dTDP-4-amino-4,6-dideoxygalactose transaminase
LEAFEREWSQWCGARGAVGVANGTEAITIALLASGAVQPGRGDEVVTSPLTAGYTALAILRAGAVPVFADIDPETLLITPASIEAVLTPRTSALLPVHLYGQMAEMEAILALAAARGIAVIEDACQAHGAALTSGARKRAGALGLAGAHSFYPTKNLGAIGDGGAIVSDDEDLLARARVLRFGGQTRTYFHEDAAGMNSRLDELQAAILRAKLTHLEAWTEERRRLAAHYLAGLSGLANGGIELPRRVDPVQHVYHLFVVRSGRRDELKGFLAERDVQALIHYPQPLHRQPAFAAGARGPLPVAEAAARSVLSLPLYPGMPDTELDQVIEALRAFSRQGVAASS